jgi:hypothetical protein
MSVEQPEKTSLDDIDVCLELADDQEPGFFVKSVEADRDLLICELAKECAQSRLAIRQEALEAAKAATSACTHILRIFQTILDLLQVIVPEHYTVEVLQALVLRSKAHLQEATEVQADIERKIEIDTVLLGEYEIAVQKQIEVCAQLGKRKRQLAKENCDAHRK